MLFHNAFTELITYVLYHVSNQHLSMCFFLSIETIKRQVMLIALHYLKCFKNNAKKQGASSPLRVYTTAAWVIAWSLCWMSPFTLYCLTSSLSLNPKAKLPNIMFKKLRMSSLFILSVFCQFRQHKQIRDSVLGHENTSTSSHCTIMNTDWGMTALCIIHKNKDIALEQDQHPLMQLALVYKIYYLWKQLAWLHSNLSLLNQRPTSAMSMSICTVQQNPH